MAAPPKLPPTVRYAEAEYWESRYQREPAVFEWFFGHTALRRIIRAYVTKKKPVLHLGCGTSNLQEGMAKSGYTVVNTDISTVVITKMKERHAKYSNLSYVVSDCRAMPEFLDCQFGHVVDKGTIDALLCCKQGTENVMRMLLEAYRVLQPGGSFLLVTLGDPTRRLPLLLDPRLQWKVSLLLLPKISAACQAYVDGKPINDTVKPIDADGPYEVLDAETIVGLPAGVQYSNFFFAYVCKKQPLQLPQAQGQKAQVPNGWVAGSKELFQKLQKELGLPEDLLAKGRRKRVMVVPAGSAAASGLHGMQLQGSGSGSSSSATGGGSSAAAGAPKQQLAAGVDAHELPDVPAGRQGVQDSDAAQQQQQQQELPPHPYTPDHEQEHGDLSPRYQQQEQQQHVVQQHVASQPGRSSGTATSSMPGSPLMQLHLQRQQQQAAVAKLEAILASNVAAQMQLQQQQQQRTQGQVQPQPQQQVAAPAEPHPQQMPAACGVDLQDVPARPASAPNLSQLARAAAAEEFAASAAAGRQASGELGETCVLQLPDPVAFEPAVPGGSATQSIATAAEAAQAPGAFSAVQLSPAAAPAECELQLGPVQAQEQPVAIPVAILQQTEHQTAASAAAAAAEAPATPGWHVLGRPSPAEAAALAAAAPAAAAAAEPPATPGWHVLGRPSPAEAAALAAAAAAAAAAATPGPMSPPSGLTLLPRAAASSGRTPRLRRFSTDPTAFAMAAALSPQLALLRQAQSQHSERAADGLIMHDVAAAEAWGGGAAAAAALAAAASWGRTRPPRGRRLSGVSMISNISTFSSASMSVNGEEDSETAEEFGSSLCTTGDSLIAEGAGEGRAEEDGEEGQQPECGEADDSSSSADLAAAVSRLAVGPKAVGAGDGGSSGGGVCGSCAEQ